ALANRVSDGSFRTGAPGSYRSPEDQAARTKTFLSNKFYALDRDNAEFCYQLCRAIDARRIVEIGTSYGVSTIYLAAALRDNLGAAGGEGVVTGTEHEPEKARATRARTRARKGKSGAGAFPRSGFDPFHRSPRGRSAGDTPTHRRAGRFRAR